VIRRGLTILGLYLVFLPVAFAQTLQLDGEPVPLTLRAVPLNPKAPQQTKVGELFYLGGFELIGKHFDFGGLSSLAVADDESHFIAMTDRANWVCGQLLTGPNRRFLGMENVWVAPLKPVPGFKMKAKVDTDSEALAITPDRRSAFVSFEGEHRVWRYDIADPDNLCSVAQSHAQAVDMPEALIDLPVNGGVESLTVLENGDLLAIGEDRESDLDAQPAWLLSPGTDTDGEAVAAKDLTYPAPKPYQPTDIQAANGGIFILHRHFSVLSGISGHVAWMAWPDGEVAETLPIAHVLATLTPPLSIDNFEGISALPDGQGGYVIYIVSDDNFADYQRTLMLKFYWPGPKEAR